MGKNICLGGGRKNISEVMIEVTVCCIMISKDYISPDLGTL